MNSEDPILDHEANLAFLREGRGGLTLGATYYGTEAQYRQAHGLDIPEEAETSDAEPDGSEKDQNNHETILVLTPGSAVFVYGASPDEPRRWIASDDFELFLQPGEAGTDSDGLVRELLVGGFRQPADDDFEHDQGIFVPDSEWDDVVGAVHRERLELVEEIGFDPEAPRPDESKPRGASWLVERADSDAQLADADAKLTDANAKLAALESELAALKSSSGLPSNLRETLTGITGVGDKLADAIIAALVPSPTQ